MPTDPVCGMMVRDGPEAIEGAVAGHRYVFCSRGCQRRFTSPERELAWMTRSAALAISAGAVLLAVPMLGVLQEPALGWVLLVLGTAVQAIAGWPFYQGLRHAVRSRAATMDTLIAMGTTAAWLFGALEVLSPELLVPGRQQYYFEVGALVLGFLAVGRALELRISGAARVEVRRLLELQPATARVLQGGVEAEVAVEDIVPEDVVVVRGGERVPVDGVVVAGHAAVDEKLLTGEALPVDKRVGDAVIGGSVNRGGTLQLRATRVGEASALGRIAALIGQAQTGPPRRRLVDAVSAWFVPLVVAAALLTLAGWYYLGGATLPFAFSAMVAVLLIACPSALGLATPAALSVGVSRGAREGLLTKDAAVLERLQGIDTVVFDKTGTLTAGDPALTEVVAVAGDEEEVLALAASAERGSEHPLGKALVRAAMDRGLAAVEPAKVQVFAGAGVEARVHRDEVLVGNLRLMHDRRIDLAPIEAQVQRLQDEGKTVVLVARNDEVVGCAAFADPIRPEAREAVQRLQAQGMEVAMITGDNVRAARAVARELGLKRTFAEISPHGKTAVVKALQDGGRTVAMVGDGINDAPALAAADVGIAIGAGAEVAVGAADLVLMRNDPRDIPAAIALGRKTTLRVRQNLQWAFAYNAVLLPIAALGLLSPVVAGLAMAFSTVPVLGNSVRIARTWDEPERAVHGTNGTNGKKRE